MKIACPFEMLPTQPTPHITDHQMEICGKKLYRHLLMMLLFLPMQFEELKSK
jgi:hypothetical protein